MNLETLIEGGGFRPASSICLSRDLQYYSEVNGRNSSRAASLKSLGIDPYPALDQLMQLADRLVWFEVGVARRNPRKLELDRSRYHRHTP